MNSRVLKIAGSVLRMCSRERPADAVLRAELRKQAGLSPEMSAAVARAVFAWFRWHGWLDLIRPTEETIPAAVVLESRYSADPASFSDAELIERSVPGWVREHLDVTPAWVRQLQSKPPLWLRARRGQGSELALELGSCRIPHEALLPDAVEFQGADNLFHSPAFHAGRFEVQDLSSQMVGLLCAPQPTETWWDACAGEGGKMLHLSDLMQNKGLIWASDRAAWRLKRLKLRAARAQAFNYRAVPWEGGPKIPVNLSPGSAGIPAGPALIPPAGMPAPPASLPASRSSRSSGLPTKTLFHGVLLDAPCSGVGTWQRNPHARWTTTAQDVRELAAVQQELLGRVASAVKPGGRLVYAVCTLTRPETVEVVDAFERAFPAFKPRPMMHPLHPDQPPSHSIWLRPEDGGNGMFVASWTREP